METRGFQMPFDGDPRTKKRAPRGNPKRTQVAEKADKDSGQKSLLSELLWDWGYFVQPSVKLVHSLGSDTIARELTDIDVYGILMTREINIERLTGDCKSLQRISPINRTFWLKGVMEYLAADRGIIVLRSESEEDHKLTAKSMGITLLDDSAFMVFRDKLHCQNLARKTHLFETESWQYFDGSLADQHELEPLLRYRKFRFWRDSYHRGARYSLMETRGRRAFLRPDQRHHVALVGDMVTLFSLTLQGMICDLFPVYLVVDNKAALDNYLKSYLYGGRDSYTIMNSLYQQANKLREAKAVPAATETTNLNELALPEWSSFIQLFRALLEHPSKMRDVPRFLRWVVFDRVLYPDSSSKLKEVIPEIDTLTVKLALQILIYFCKASALEPHIAQQLETHVTDAMLSVASP